MIGFDHKIIFYKFLSVAASRYAFQKMQGYKNLNISISAMNFELKQTPMDSSCWDHFKNVFYSSVTKILLFCSVVNDKTIKLNKQNIILWHLNFFVLEIFTVFFFTISLSRHEANTKRDTQKATTMFPLSTLFLCGVLLLLIVLLITILIITIKRRLRIHRLRKQLATDYSAEIRNLNRQNETRVLLFPMGRSVQPSPLYSNNMAIPHKNASPPNHRHTLPIFTTSL